MSFTLNREELLQVLESVSPGLSPRGIIQQSNCFVFRNGRVVTFNDMIACKSKTKFPKDFTGAVKAEPLLEILRKLEEDVVEILTKDSHICIRGKGKTTKIRMEEEIVLEIDTIDKPGEWIALPDGFSEAIQTVQECAGTDETDFELTCVHVGRKFVEASDSFQIGRHYLTTGLSQSVLFKRDALKHIPALGMTHISEATEWTHFRNLNGLIFSCRRYIEDYPKLGQYLKMEGGTKTNLPKGLGKTLDRANIFTKEKEENTVMVVLKDDRIKVQGIGESGEHGEVKKIRYSGKPVAFLISPKLLTQITERYNEVIISQDVLKVEGSSWIYTTTLGDPNEVQRAEEERQAAKERESEDSGEEGT